MAQPNVYSQRAPCHETAAGIARKQEPAVTFAFVFFKSYTTHSPPYSKFWNFNPLPAQGVTLTTTARSGLIRTLLCTPNPRCCSALCPCALAQQCPQQWMIYAAIFRQWGKYATSKLVFFPKYTNPRLLELTPNSWSSKPVYQRQKSGMGCLACALTPATLLWFRNGACSTSRIKRTRTYTNRWKIIYSWSREIFPEGLP